MATFDLHVHTTASDGKFSPTAVVESAKKLGLKAIAITDHDTTDGISEALLAGNSCNMIIIPGIELSTDYKEREVHILGYLMDYMNQDFQKRLVKFREDREERAKKMVTRLNELGFDINYAEVRELTSDGTVGRPHIAQVLISKGYINSIAEAFDKYIGREKPAYVPRAKLTPHQAVSLIRSFSGIPVMAHPGLADLDRIIPELVEEGLMGLEVYHPDHGLQDIIKYQTIANAHNLLITGGSDFHGHGAQTKCSLGVPNLDMDIVTNLLEAKESI